MDLKDTLSYPDHFNIQSLRFLAGLYKVLTANCYNTRLTGRLP